MIFIDNLMHRLRECKAGQVCSLSTCLAPILPTSCKLVLLSLAGLLLVGRAVAIPDNQEVFTEANALYEQANVLALVNPSEAQDLYQSSILKYQFLVEKRNVNTAGLHTNLGNAYFAAGEQGWAVLHYQRALALSPLDGDVLHNLHYVRSLTIDELPKTRTQIVQDTLTFWHRWPFVHRATCFGLTHASFWVLVAMLFYRRERWLYWSIGTTATLSLIFGLSLLASHQRWDNPVDGVVVAREVIARQGNGLIYDNAFTSPLHAGTEFSVIEQRGDWYYVRLLNGDTCWLPVDSAELVGH
ncbi:MAG: tetratricopeptide repeat protein [Akkermansiaceae bacterium]|nr:tetratricopeptide repeat protein [Akkermansiaceae bacterium]